MDQAEQLRIIKANKQIRLHNKDCKYKKICTVYKAVCSGKNGFSATGGLIFDIFLYYDERLFCER